MSSINPVGSNLIVVKAGGAEGVDFTAICEDIAHLASLNQPIILVHGGSSETNQLGEALGYPPRFITSPSGYTSRYTDKRTLEIFIMAVKGKINPLLVAELQKRGVNALGLSGIDGRILVARRKKAIRSVVNGKRKVIRDDYSGKIERVNHVLLKSLINQGYLPVLAPLAIGFEGEALNVDADRAAAMIAGAMGADTLVLLTSAPGLMSAYPDESTLIDLLPREDLDKAKTYAQGRMKKKVLGAQEALQAGTLRVIIADGRVHKPIQRALAGDGTHIS